MDFIADLPVVGGFLSSALAFVVVLGIVVFVHEYGHYIVGRWCGIHADTFSLGFGKRLYSWVDKRGTRWQIAALPLGGYVRFLGDADGSSRADEAAMAEMDEELRARSFHGAAVWKRMATVAAGPFANFLLSAAVFAGLVMVTGVATERPVVGTLGDVPGIEQTVEPGDLILSVNGKPIDQFDQIYEIAQEMEVPGPLALEVERDGRVLDAISAYPLPPLVFGVEPLSPAQNAGLKAGDFIRYADGVTLNAFGDLRDVVMASGDKTIVLEIVRDGSPVSLEITPRLREMVTRDGEVDRRVMIGVTSDALIYPPTERLGVFAALWHGAGKVVEVIDMSLTGLKHIILGNLGAENLQGPLGIAQISGQSATQGWTSFIGLIAIISTAIGMLNLFPIPVLDGGHLVMHAYEAVAGRPPAERFMRIAMSIGLAMVLLLMVFATYNDVMRWAIS